MRCLLFILSTIIIFSSCKKLSLDNLNSNRLYKYPNDTTVCDNNGKPKLPKYYGKEFNYFPLKIFIDSLKLSEQDAINHYYEEIERYSELLKNFQEPILYNKYLKKEIYRFTYYPSCYRPLVFRIEKDRFGKITLVSKKIYWQESWKCVEYTMNGKAILQKKQIPNIRIEEDIKVLNIEQWNKIDSLVKLSNFLQLAPTIANDAIPSIDGRTWIFEVHNKYGYYAVSRKNPNNFPALFDLGNYLVSLSTNGWDWRNYKLNGDE